MAARPTLALAAAPVIAALAAAVAVLPGRDATPPPTVPEATDLAVADQLDVRSVDDLVEAAACVAAGEVVATERGRALGPELVTRLVQLRIDRPLAGSCPTGAVVIEEEGWLADGTAVTVQGWPSTAVGDEGVWFLVPGSSDELPYAATVATSGALRWRDGEPLLPPDPPGWVLAATDDGPGGLARQVDGAER